MYVHTVLFTDPHNNWDEVRGIMVRLIFSDHETGFLHFIKRMNMASKKKIIMAGVLLIAIGAAVQVVYSTQWGLSAGSDSSVYLAAARNLLNGEGLRILQPSGKAATLMPPLYSLSLAALGGMNLDILQAARWFNVALWMITILLTGFSVITFSRTPGLAIPASMIVALYPTALGSFSSMMTEPLFLTLLLLCILLFLAYLESGRYIWIAAAGLTAGLMTLTRFIGYVFFPVGLVVALLLSRIGWKRRFLDALIFVGAYLLPVLIWLTWFYFNPDASPILGRPLWTNPWDYLAPVRAGMVSTLWGGLPFSEYLPSASKWIRTAVLAGLVFVWAVSTLWASIRLLGKHLSVWMADRDIRMILLAGLFFLCFVFGFIFVYLFRNPAQDVDARTLIPLFPALVLVLIGSLSIFIRAAKGKMHGVAQIFSALLLVVICAGYLPANWAMAKNQHDNGSGYSSPSWRSSQTIQYLNQIPLEKTIISNDTGAVLFFTNRTALEFNQSFSKLPLTAFTRYGDDPIDDAQKLFHNRQAVLVLFTPALYWQLEPHFYDQTQQRIDSLLGGLEKLSETSDGGIYRYPAQP